MSTITKPAQAIETSAKPRQPAQAGQVDAVGVDPRRAGRHRRRVRVLSPTQVPLHRATSRRLAQNVAVWAVLGVGMTFVIITSGIDLSVGSVLVFSSVVSAKVMQAVGGEGWGVALIGLLVAVVVGLSWGVLNGFLVAKAKIPPLIVTLGTLSVALGLAQVITGGIDIRSAPTVLQDYITYSRIVGIPAICLRRPGRRDHRRDRAAQDEVRPLHLRDRLQRDSAPPGRHQRRPPPDPDLRPLRLARRPRRAALPRPVRHHHHRRPVADQPQRHRGGRHRRHVDLRRRGLDLRHRRRPVHPRRFCRPASSSSASSPSGRASPSARSWSPPSTSTSPAAPRPAGARASRPGAAPTDSAGQPGEPRRHPHHLHHISHRRKAAPHEEHHQARGALRHGRPGPGRVQHRAPPTTSSSGSRGRRQRQQADRVHPGRRR